MLDLVLFLSNSTQPPRSILSYRVRGDRQLKPKAAHPIGLTTVPALPRGKRRWWRFHQVRRTHRVLLLVDVSTRRCADAVPHK